MLIVLNHLESSGSNKIRLKSVKISDDKAELVLSRKTPSGNKPSTDDVKTWCFLIEMNWHDVTQINYIVK